MQVQLAMRYFQHAKMLSVGLSRLLRANPEIRAMIPELSIVSPDTGGLPVAYGVCEALRAHQVYWAERKEEDGPMRFRQYLEQIHGEKVLLVDDILRSGKNISELKRLVESSGAEVVGLAVMIYQPNPTTVRFRPAAAVLSGRSWTRCITRMPRRVGCAGTACRWRRSGCRAGRGSDVRRAGRI